MADTLLFRGGSTGDVNNGATTVSSRELVIDTDTDEIVSGPNKLRTLMQQANGDVHIGGTLPASPNISLNADGSASFDGSVGINTTSPDQSLSVKGLISTKDGGGTTRGLIGSPTWDSSKIAIQNGTLAESAANVALQQDVNGSTIVNAASGRTVDLAISNGPILRLDSSGRILVRTLNWYKVPDSIYGSDWSQGQQIKVAGSGAQGGLAVINDSNGASSRTGEIGLCSQDSLGDYAILSANTPIGAVTFSGADGSAFIRAASIRADVDGTPGANDMPGRLVFSTTADGASSPTERLRIDSDGLATFAGNIATTGVVFGTPSAPVTSNTLDDYEEGTFTPTLLIGGTAVATSSASGHYVKIGNTVNIRIHISPAAAPGAGRVTLGGLPFRAKAGAFANQAALAIQWSGTLGTTGLLANTNATTVQFRDLVANGDLDGTTIGSNSNLGVCGTYPIV